MPKDAEGHEMTPTPTPTVEELQEELDAANHKLWLLANEMVYEGNSVSFIYSKVKAYGQAIDNAWAALKQAEMPPDGNTPLHAAITRLAQRLASPAPEAGQPEPERLVHPPLLSCVLRGLIDNDRLGNKWNRDDVAAVAQAASEIDRLTALAAQPVPQPAALDSLHAAIMKIPLNGGVGWVPDCMTPNERNGYHAGHRDARHAAAELVSAAQAVVVVPQEAPTVKWLVVRETVVEVAGCRPMLGYTVVDDLGSFKPRTFDSFAEASLFIRSHNLELGWVAMQTTQSPWSTLFPAAQSKEG